LYALGPIDTAAQYIKCCQGRAGFRIVRQLGLKYRGHYRKTMAHRRRGLDLIVKVKF